MAAALNKWRFSPDFEAAFIMVCPLTQVRVSLIRAAGRQDRVITHFQTGPEVVEVSDGKLQHRNPKN